MEENESLIKGEVTVDRVLWKASDNPFKIISLRPVNIHTGSVETTSYGNFTVKGNAPDVSEGDEYQVVLTEEAENEKYGKQYSIKYIGNPVDINDKKSQRIFLERVLGDKRAKVLYDTLENPFQSILEGDIKSLMTCKGIGDKTARSLIRKYKENINYSKAYVELDKFDLTDNMIHKLVSVYKSPDIVIEKIKENPYILATEINGIGFKKADEIALKGGMDRKSKFRLESFIQARLQECAENGHSYIHPAELFKSLSEVLDIDLQEIGNELREVLSDMYDRKVVWYNEERSMISLERIRKLESEISEEVLRLLGCSSEDDYGKWSQVLDKTEEKQNWEFTDEQRNGIEKALHSQVSIITGGAGVGKSSVVSGVLDVLHKEYDESFAQTALSGKASARLAEVTGEEGYTIHRLLGFDATTHRFTHGKDLPLSQDVIIVDEISMVGARIFHDLIQAVKDGAKLILIGDIFQLDSIGVGSITKDMIDSGIISVVNLTKIHRQAAKSAIVTESIKVKEGIQLVDADFDGVDVRGELQDLVLDIYSDKEQTYEKVISHFKSEYAKSKNILEVQIIVPVKYRGNACRYEINNAVQNVYNPSNGKKDEITISIDKDKKYILREGDKVINTQNNYKTMNPDGDETHIYNGDIGVIIEIDNEFGEITIEFERIGDVIIDRSDWKKIILAYAITIHASQGSQFNTVITALDYTAYTLLSKEIVYTAMTRAKEKSILCAENKALRYAIKTSKVEDKRTFLKQFLQEGKKKQLI